MEVLTLISPVRKTFLVAQLGDLHSMSVVKVVTKVQNYLSLAYKCTHMLCLCEIRKILFLRHLVPENVAPTPPPSLSVCSGLRLHWKSRRWMEKKKTFSAAFLLAFEPNFDCFS